jgi:hypothetical protein
MAVQTSRSPRQERFDHVRVGMSVALDDYRHLPVHRLPLPLGSERDPVYRLTADQLPAELTLRADTHQHGLVEPGLICKLDDYERALERTRRGWKKVYPDV